MTGSTTAIFVISVAIDWYAKSRISTLAIDNYINKKATTISLGYHDVIARIILIYDEKRETSINTYIHEVEITQSE